MKKLWKNNRVVFVLVIILIICFIAICSVALTFFYSKDTNEYGNRLDGIEKHQISSEFKSSYKEKFLESENPILDARYYQSLSKSIPDYLLLSSMPFLKTD